jgi:hypothetical protein
MTATALKVEPENDVNRVNVIFDGLSLAELAALLGERPHKLSRFVEAGVLERDRDGRFAIVENVTRYWRFWARVVRESARSERDRGT